MTSRGITGGRRATLIDDVKRSAKLAITDHAAAVDSLVHGLGQTYTRYGQPCLRSKQI